MSSDITDAAMAEKLARMFYEIHEKLRPVVGDDALAVEETVAWSEVPEANKTLMLATAAQVVDQLDLVRVLEALSFYADFEANADEDGQYGQYGYSIVRGVWEHDQGDRAREVLGILTEVLG